MGLRADPLIAVAEEARSGPPPGEAYAEQRTRDFRWLRFSPALEQEYRAHMREDQRIAALVCAANGAAIWLGFLTFDLTRLDLGAEMAAGHVDALAVVGLRSATLATLVLSLIILKRQNLQAGYHRFSIVVLIMLGITACISSNIYKMRGLPHADLAQFAIIMATFLPIGLTFYQSLATAAVVATATTVSGPAMLGPELITEHLRMSALLFLAAFIGAVGAHLREYAQRDQFLLKRLLHLQATVDGLTGIANRRYFEQHAATVLAQAKRDQTEVILAIVDIDHFKLYNDHYGHQAGDLALRRVACQIKTGLRRPLDLVGRLGGEEFGVLFYGAAPQSAQMLLDALVASTVKLAIRHEASSTAPCLTISIGAACFDGSETLETLYRRADELLYDSKAQGRNRAIMELHGPVRAVTPRLRAQG